MQNEHDWHYASILGLSMCIGARIISTKTAPEKFAIVSHIQRVRSCETGGSKFDNNATEAMKAHT